MFEGGISFNPCLSMNKWKRCALLRWVLLQFHRKNQSILVRISIGTWISGFFRKKYLCSICIFLK